MAKGSNFLFQCIATFISIALQFGVTNNNSRQGIIRDYLYSVVTQQVKEGRQGTGLRVGKAQSFHGSRKSLGMGEYNSIIISAFLGWVEYRVVSS